MEKDVLNKCGLKIGDRVARIAVGAFGDNFKCHEYSFGRIRAFQIETEESRPDAAPKFKLKKWVEILVMPHDDKMAPEKERPWIQWGPEEVIKLSKFQYFIKVITWPVVKRIYNRPLDGRNTDRILNT